jgi:hypothetical protein
MKNKISYKNSQLEDPGIVLKPEILWYKKYFTNPKNVIPKHLNPG